jgi:hypothetical protein
MDCPGGSKVGWGSIVVLGEGMVLLGYRDWKARELL